MVINSSRSMGTAKVKASSTVITNPESHKVKAHIPPTSNSQATAASQDLRRAIMAVTSSHISHTPMTVP